MSHTEGKDLLFKIVNVDTQYLKEQLKMQLNVDFFEGIYKIKYNFKNKVFYDWQCTYCIWFLLLLKKNRNDKLGDCHLPALGPTRLFFFFLSGKYDILSFCLFDWKDD